MSESGTPARFEYQAAPDLGIVTSYFNPCRYRTRAENFERFVAPIRAAGIPLVIVEARFDGGEWTLDPRHGSMRVMARDLMWQKERLLDMGMAWLPEHCTKVAWLDADVLFEDPAWARKTSDLLETAMVVQPFSDAVRLAPRSLSPSKTDDRHQSFAAMYTHKPESLEHGRYELHGHTGFAWAARRDLLAHHGLYDTLIAGSADHLMAHAFAGDLNSKCIVRTLGTGGRHLAHFRKWARRVHADVEGRLAYVPGQLLHLWHGTIAKRRYAERNRELRAFGFDPAVDLRIADNGCWAWASEKPELHAWSRRYFADREEDDDEGEAPASPARVVR
jgi:hypothetical protein